MNLADGCGRDTEAEFRKSVSAAMGAASQLEYQLLLAHDLGHMPAQEHTRLTDDTTEIKRMITGLIQSLHG
jgi:four helix bundle protein